MNRLIFFILILPLSVQAQYAAEAPLSEVKSNGFYQITLPPNITAALYSDLGNIRIIDSQEAEVPYVVRYEQPEYNTFEWTPMRIEKDTRKGCCTVITLMNEEKDYLDNFLLQVKNAEIDKNATLRGSDDGQVWYALAENFSLVFGMLETSEVSQIFDFPLSNYKYYRLTINDSTTSPLNVVAALRTHEDIVHGSLIEIPNVSITSRDTLQGYETWAVIKFDTAQYIDRVEFDVTGPHLFKRQATLFRRVKDKTRSRFEAVQSFDIISGQARSLSVGYKEKELFIRVDNENNPPLRFTAVAAYQFKRSLIAYLEKGRDYRIALSNELKTPYYDLGFFKDSIPAHPGELEIGKLKERSILKTPESSTFFTDKKFIWIAIILVAIVLAAMSIKMLREKDLDKTKQD